MLALKVQDGGSMQMTPLGAVAFLLQDLKHLHSNLRLLSTLEPIHDGWHVKVGTTTFRRVQEDAVLKVLRMKTVRQVHLKVQDQ
jgi:hypothetical protein